MSDCCVKPLGALSLTIAALAFLGCALSRSHAQDSLRIIELSEPGQSAPVSIPAGYAFTFSLFSPDSGKGDPEAAVGVVSYGASFSYESKLQISFVNTNYDGWYLGPAKVVLKGSGAGARMQLYMMKLPPGVVWGILHSGVATHSVSVPKGSLLTPLLGFQEPIPYSDRPRAFINYLSIRRPNGVTYGVTQIDLGYGWSGRAGTPRLRGSATLHNPDAPASSVVKGLYNDDFDSVSPTADFVGPGTATFSLPPEGERSTPVAFFCYRITAANVIGLDALPPVVKVTTPATTSATTTLAAYTMRGSVTDNIEPTSVRFRARAPGSPSFGNWAPLSLAGSGQTKNWQRAFNLSLRGAWQIQVQAFDGEQNASTVQTITLTRQ